MLKRKLVRIGSTFTGSVRALMDESNFRTNSSSKTKTEPEKQKLGTERLKNGTTGCLTNERDTTRKGVEQKKNKMMRWMQRKKIIIHKVTKAKSFSTSKSHSDDVRVVRFFLRQLIALPRGSSAALC